MVWKKTVLLGMVLALVILEGCVSPGGSPGLQPADLVILDRNLFRIEPSEISDAKVLLTLLGGEPVFGNFEDVATSP